MLMQIALLHFSCFFYFQRKIYYGTEDEQTINHMSNVQARAKDYKRNGGVIQTQTSITNCLQLEDPIALWSRHWECARHRMSLVSYSKRCIVPWALLYWFSNGINDCRILTGFLHGLAEKL